MSDSCPPPDIHLAIAAFAVRESPAIEAHPVLGGLTHAWSFWSRQDTKISWSCSCLLSTTIPYHALCAERVIPRVAAAIQLREALGRVLDHVERTPFLTYDASSDFMGVFGADLLRLNRIKDVSEKHNLSSDPDLQHRVSVLCGTLCHEWGFGRPKDNTVVLEWTSACCGLVSSAPWDAYCGHRVARLLEGVEAEVMAFVHWVADAKKGAPAGELLPWFFEKMQRFASEVPAIRARLHRLDFA